MYGNNRAVKEKIMFSKLYLDVQTFIAADSPFNHGGGWAFCIKQEDDAIVRSDYHPRADVDALLLMAVIEALKAVNPRRYPSVRVLVYITRSMFTQVKEGPNPAVATLLKKLARLRQRYPQFQFVTVDDDYGDFRRVWQLAGRAS